MIFYSFYLTGDDPRFLKFLISKSISPNGTTLLIDLHLPSKDTVGMYPLHWVSDCTSLSDERSYDNQFQPHNQNITNFHAN